MIEQYFASEIVADINFSTLEQVKLHSSILIIGNLRQYIV